MIDMANTDFSNTTQDTRLLRLLTEFNHLREGREQSMFSWGTFQLSASEEYQVCIADLNRFYEDSVSENFGDDDRLFLRVFNRLGDLRDGVESLNTLGDHMVIFQKLKDSLDQVDHYLPKEALEHM